MTDNVTPLFPGQVLDNTPEPGVVAILEEMLERAKTGELRTAALVFATNDGCILTASHIPDHMFTTVGGLAYLSRKLCDRLGGD